MKMYSSSSSTAVFCSVLLFGNGVMTTAAEVRNSGTNLVKEAIPCPGSPARIHAKCQMIIQFPSTDCGIVQEEIIHRILGDNGWVDPHNGGQYKLLDEEEKIDSRTIINTLDNKDVISGSRRTGNDKYTDLFQMTFEQQQDGDCIVTACSESQVTSVIDFSTNYCNLHNLYCSSHDGCDVVQHDFVNYQEQYKNCSQKDVSQCDPTLSSSSSAGDDQSTVSFS